MQECLRSNYSIRDSIRITFNEGMSAKKIAMTMATNTDNTYDDIMSTMSNVLFFTYLCSLLPIFVLAIRNGYSISHFVKNNYSLLAKKMLDEADSIYDEAKKQVADAIFTVNYETGELEYSSSVYTFSINDNGELEWEVNDK